MTFDSPEIEKLRKVFADCGPASAMKATFQTSHGVVEVDLILVLLELAARDDSNLHFMDPPKHHADVYPPPPRVTAADNPTGQAAVGSP